MPEIVSYSLPSPFLTACIFVGPAGLFSFIVRAISENHSIICTVVLVYNVLYNLIYCACNLLFALTSNWGDDADVVLVVVIDIMPVPNLSVSFYLEAAVTGLGGFTRTLRATFQPWYWFLADFLIKIWFVSDATWGTPSLVLFDATLSFLGTKASIFWPLLRYTWCI